MLFWGHFFFHLLNLHTPLSYPTARAALMGNVSWVAGMQPAIPRFRSCSGGMGMEVRAPGLSRAKHAKSAPAWSQARHPQPATDASLVLALTIFLLSAPTCALLGNPSWSHLARPYRFITKLQFLYLKKLPSTPSMEPWALASSCV